MLSFPEIYVIYVFFLFLYKETFFDKRLSKLSQTKLGSVQFVNCDVFKAIVKTQKPVTAMASSNLICKSNGNFPQLILLQKFSFTIVW